MEKVNVDENGKKHIERVYVGSYYSQDVTKKRRIILKLTYVLLYLISVIIFVAVSVRPTESNLSDYVQFVSFLVLILTFFMFMFLVKYISSPIKMTIAEYKQGPVGLKIMSLMTPILMMVQGLAVLVFIFLSKDADIADEMINMIGYIIGSCLMYVIFYIESRIPYEEIQNKVSFLRGGYYIDN
jgi:hypothetical protein